MLRGRIDGALVFATKLAGQGIRQLYIGLHLYLLRLRPRFSHLWLRQLSAWRRCLSLSFCWARMQALLHLQA